MPEPPPVREQRGHTAGTYRKSNEKRTSRYSTPRKWKRPQVGVFDDQTDPLQRLELPALLGLERLRLARGVNAKEPPQGQK
jgi:hypothetical protein